MTTTELKQRIAEWGDGTPPTKTIQLLDDCLKHIEELEEKIHKLESAKVWTRLDQLQSQLREREADCAAMRLCLEKSNNVFHKLLLDDWLNMRKQALSTTAGRELLERLQKAEKERDELKRVFGKDQSWPLDDVLLSLRSAALHLLHDHDCDHQGHETIQCNVDRAQNYVFAIGKALQPKEAK